MTEKQTKKVGIIRKGAVIPFLIVSTIIILFNIFFLDGMIKKSIEYFGGKINGAEVNVADVTTSFKDLSVVVKRVAFTNASAPKTNLFEIGQIKFQMMWDAILRAKIVIDESSINDIQVATDRKSEGEVYPKPLDDPKNPSVAKNTLNNAKEEFKGNIFGDISALLAGDSSSDVLKNIEGELKSKKFYENLQAQVDQKEEELKKMMADLPKSAEINQFDDRFKAINWDDMKDLKKAAKVLKQANELRKDVSDTVKKYEEATDRVQSEVKFLKDSSKQAEKLIDEDIKGLESKMSIPSLDSESIASVIFGADFVNTLAKYNEYFEMAKQYMPPKKEKEATSVKTPRGEGRNYQFGTPTSYPLFWLKLANISSKNEQGNVAGKIENITTNQKIVNKPSTAYIKGDFPSKQVRNVEGNIVFDHRTIVNDKISVSVGAFPLQEKVLSKSDSVSFIMAKSSVASVVEAKLVKDQVTMSMNNVFTNIDYQVAAKSKQVEELLNGVADEAKRVTVDASASGTMEKLGFKIKTNLAELIKSAVGKQLQAKIAEARNKIRGAVDKQIGGNKAKAEEKIEQLKSKYTGEINKQKEKIKELTGKIDSKKDGAKGGLEEKGKDVFKSLKKKFKF